MTPAMATIRTDTRCASRPHWMVARHFFRVFAFPRYRPHTKSRNGSSGCKQREEAIRNLMPVEVISKDPSVSILGPVTRRAWRQVRMGRFIHFGSTIGLGSPRFGLRL